MQTGGKSLEVIIGLVNCVLSRTIFLGAFAQLRNATFSCVTSVRPSVRPSLRPSVRMEQNNMAPAERIVTKYCVSTVCRENSTLVEI